MRSDGCGYLLSEPGTNPSHKLAFAAAPLVLRCGEYATGISNPTPSIVARRTKCNLDHASCGGPRHSQRRTRQHRFLRHLQLEHHPHSGRRPGRHRSGSAPRASCQLMVECQRRAPTRCGGPLVQERGRCRHQTVPRAGRALSCGRPCRHTSPYLARRAAPHFPLHTSCGSPSTSRCALLHLLPQCHTSRPRAPGFEPGCTRIHRPTPRVLQNPLSLRDFHRTCGHCRPPC
mmetsp:Transcript_120793/g.301390  ORF Transcript_120793/g.301390 Transcript_120793/m.301390 type:complete len:231 (+) Transcript_120793:1042-1734(+)